MEQDAPPSPAGPAEEAQHVLSDDRSAPAGAESQEPSSPAAAGTAASALQAPLADEAAEAPLPEGPLPEAEAESEDKVKVMSRQLSRLSIPDMLGAADAEAEAEGAGQGDSPGFDGEAASLSGLEELPEQLSPGKANFSHSTEPSPELYERVAVGGADAAAAASPPEGYYPRSKSVSPVQRKIAQLEAEAWAGIPFDPKPTPSRLERELGFPDFRRNEQSAADRAPHSDASSPTKSPKQRSTEEGGPAQGGGPTPEAMSEMLQRHKEKQERLRELAAVRSPERPPVPPSSQALMQQQAEAWGGESLDDVMVPSKSRLQLEKEEWEARRAAEAAAGGEAAVAGGEAAAAGGEAALAAAAPGGIYRCSSLHSSAESESEGACGDVEGVEDAGEESQLGTAAVGGAEAEAEVEEGELVPGEDDLADEFGGMSLEELEAALAAAEAEAAAAAEAAEAGGGGGYVTSAAGFAGLSLADLQKRKSRLERERDAALAAAAPRVARSSLPEAVQGPGLEEDLLKRKSRLQQERETALAAAAPRVSAGRSARSSAQEEEPLELKQHKSKLEQEQEAALAAAAPRVSAGRSARSSVQESEAAQGALADDLVLHKSRLQQEREAALAAAAPRVSAGRSARSSVQESEAAQGGLADDLVLHKSRLQQEQEAAKAAAAAAGEAVAVKVDASSRRASSSGHEGPLEQALGSKRVSRLEQEKAAAKAAAENVAAGLGGAPAAAGAAPKTRLQLEKEAAAKAEKARAAAALLAKARAAAAAKAAAAQHGSSLGEALKPASPSKLELESEAWRRADA
ncbi:hypothetical protein ABPG75_002822 [Micractinium tetrahymenae]